jgi:outer membrane protein TolC
VDRAVQENLSLRSQRTSLQATKRETETAWNMLLPSVSASGTLNRSNEEMGGGPSLPGEPSVDAYHLSASASIDAQLTLVASIADQIERARRSYAASEHSYEEAKESTAEQVRKLFYSILLAQERIAVRETAVSTAEQNLEQVRASFEAGRVAQRTLRRAELSLEQSRLQLQESRTALEDSRATLKGLLGVEPERELELEGKLPVEAPAEGALPELESGARPDVARLGSRIEVQRARLAAAKKDRWLPSLTLGASYNPSLPDPFHPDNPPEKEWTDNGSMRITVSFGLESLLPFSQAAVTAERAAKEAAALRLDRQSAIESAEREYRSLVRSVRNARTALESQRLNVSLNEEVVQLTEEAYEAGQSDFLSLQEAQVDLAEARLALLNEAYNLKTSLIELEYASGQPSIE